jgi:hypothetical protein
MQRAAHGVTFDEAVGERPTIVGARGPHRKDLGAASRKEHPFAARMTEEPRAIGEVGDGDAVEEIGAL